MGIYLVVSMGLLLVGLLVNNIYKGEFRWLKHIIFDSVEEDSDEDDYYFDTKLNWPFNKELDLWS